MFANPSVLWTLFFILVVTFIAMDEMRRAALIHADPIPGRARGEVRQ